MEGPEESAPARIIAPAASRNKTAILEVLQRLLPSPAIVLEIGSGSGEHATSFAKALPGVTWLPSDPDPAMRASIAAWCSDAEIANIAPALDIDARAKSWAVAGRGPFDAVVSINMVHIAPWQAAVGLFAGAGRELKPNGRLLLYGPFRRDGEHTAPSNAEFDAWLKAQNAEFGLRDTAALNALAEQSGLAADEVIPMPANNFILTFAQRAAA